MRTEEDTPAYFHQKTEYSSSSQPQAMIAQDLFMNPRRHGHLKKKKNCSSLSKLGLFFLNHSYKQKIQKIFRQSGQIFYFQENPTDFQIVFL